MEPLSVTAIQHNLPTHTFGQTAIYHNRIDSTNTELKRLPVAEMTEGLLLVADEQVAGRGRFNRTWFAPPMSGLLASLAFRPAFLPPDRAQYLTMICALAALEAIEAETGLSAGLKWPNDLVYRERKLAGLLTEIGFAGHALEWVIVGMGLNVNVDFSAATKPDPDSGLPLSQTAISLQMILEKPVRRVPLLQAYLAGVERGYDSLKRGRSPQPAWAARLTTVGRQVTVTGPAETVCGLAEGVDEGGALLVRVAGGHVKRVLAGDVSLR